MTDPNYTAIALLVDRSGSMHAILVPAEDAINEFIASQAHQPGKRTIRVDQFDHECLFASTSLPAADCPPFHLEPRGSTALLDAMGATITSFGRELTAMPEDERPSTVIFAVMTDGGENSSVGYTWDQVKDIVERQERDYNWQILYLGANQDAIATGAKMGVRRDRSLTYAASDVGTRSAGDSIGNYVVTASSGLPAAFTDEDRANASRR